MCAGAVRVIVCSPINLFISRCIIREWLIGRLFPPRTQPYRAHSHKCYMCNLTAPLIAFRLCLCGFLFWRCIK
jgi:hypothetical protein